MKEKIKGKNLEFEAFAIVDNETAYAASSTFNALFKVNLITGECTYITMFQNEKCDGKRLYTKALAVDDKIYFVPTAAEEIAVYDVKTQSIDKWLIQKADKKKYTFYESNNKFSGGVLYEKYVFMIGSTYPGVLRINIQTGNIDYFAEWINGESFLFRKSPIVDGCRFYIPSVNNNLVLCFDMELCIGRLYHVGNFNKGCWSMCKAGKEFWLAPKEAGPIICWNPNTCEVKEYGNYPKMFKDNGFVFTKIYKQGDNIFLIPSYANMGIKIALTDKKISNSGVFHMKGKEFVAFMIEEENRFYLKIKKTEGIEYVYLDIAENKLYPYKFVFANGYDKFLEDYFYSVFNKSECVTESETVGLEELLGALS